MRHGVVRRNASASTNASVQRNIQPQQNLEETMDLDRRALIFTATATAACLVGLTPAWAGPEDEAAVAKHLEAFRAAQMAADGKALEALCAAELSYSHSDGRVEDRSAFVVGATSGKSKFKSLSYNTPSIRVVGNTAIVRFRWAGEQIAAADGKQTDTSLHILMTWLKQGNDWKLLSRGSTKL
jgi:hypothetical protein